MQLSGVSCLAESMLPTGFWDEAVLRPREGSGRSPRIPQLLKEPRVVFPLSLMVCVVSFPGKDGEVLPLCRMPEHLVQLKSKVGLRGLGCHWGS